LIEPLFVHREHFLGGDRRDSRLSHLDTGGEIRQLCRFRE
jgi:hypothetical protein